MTKLFYDHETYSPVDISRTLANYAPAARVLMTAWAIDDEPVDLWCQEEGQPMPKRLYEAAHDTGVWHIAHNASFEQQINDATCVFGEHLISKDRYYCTMIQALEHNLPASLENLCDVFQVDADKAKLRDGKALVKWFTCPDEHGQFRGMQPADKWARFKQYCINDVEAMRILHNKMPKINCPFDNSHIERILWLETERMNRNGFGVDLDLACASITMAERLKDSADVDMLEATGGVVSSPNQTAVLKQYILDTFDVNLPDLQAATLEKFVSDMSQPVGARQVIQARLTSAKSSVSKYKKLIQCADSRSRMTSTIVFCGASGTGRDAGRLFQPQNLPRPAEWFDGDYAEQLIEEIKDQSLDLTHSNPMAVMSSALRGSIVPAQGKKLVVSDLSNIEGRMVAYLAGEDWKVQYFRDYDSGKIKFDNYVAAASKMLGLNPEDVDKTTRQTGKVMELACFEATTKVLTNAGVKNIIDVCSTDLLWDGVEWVMHEGLIYKGLQETINLDGVRLTPDHLVLTQETWIPAGQLATHGTQLQSALARGLEALSSLACLKKALGTTAACSVTAGPKHTAWPLPRCAILKILVARCVERLEHTHPEKKSGNLRWWRTAMSRWGFASSTCLWFNALAEQTLTTSTLTTYKAEPAHDVERVLKSKALFGAKNTTATQTSLLTTSNADGCSTVLPQQSIGARTPTTSSIFGTGAEVSECTAPGGKTRNPFLRTWLRCLGGTTRFWRWIEQTMTKGMNPEICNLLRGHKIKQTGEQLLNSKPESKSLRPVYDILNSGLRNRFTVISNSGALVVHNCGYGSGVGGILQFADVYRVDLNRLASETHKIADGSLWFSTQEKYSWAQDKGFDYNLPIHQWTACDYLKQQWRNAHPNIAQLWKDCELAFRMAYMTPDVWFPAGKHLAYKRKGTWIFCRLPSGRVLSYIQPKIKDDEITYMCMDQVTNKWTRTKVYSGKFVAHATQASARDLLLQNMLKAKESGYNTILRVHDELITEVPDEENYTSDALGKHLASNLPWCPDLPLAAAGYETNVRYKKD